MQLQLIKVSVRVKMDFGFLESSGVLDRFQTQRGNITQPQQIIAAGIL